MSLIIHVNLLIIIKAKHAWKLKNIYIREHSLISNVKENYFKIIIFSINLRKFK